LPPQRALARSDRITRSIKRTPIEPRSLMACCNARFCQGQFSHRKTSIWRLSWPAGSSCSAPLDLWRYWSPCRLLARPTSPALTSLSSERSCTAPTRLRSWYACLLRCVVLAAQSQLGMALRAPSGFQVRAQSSDLPDLCSPTRRWTTCATSMASLSRVAITRTR
jgi:hypothetical protein